MSVFDRFRLDGKRLFITGGSRGLGREMALAIADAGADVVLVGRDAPSLEKTAGDIRDLGRQAWTVNADVGVPEQCEDACKQALALARTRENLCAPAQNDLNREEHQQALFNAMKSRLLSPSSFFRLPLIAWDAPPAIISDMGGVTLIGLFGSMAFSGTPPTRVLKPTGVATLPGGGQGLTVSEASRRAAVARFMNG